MSEHDISPGQFSTFFGEKSSEMSVGKLTAYGIKLESRYSKIQEMVEMLSFVELIAKHNLHQSIDSLFYDTKCNMCFIELSEGVCSGTRSYILMKEVAMLTLRQFEWDEFVCHGYILQKEHPDL